MVDDDEEDVVEVTKAGAPGRDRGKGDEGAAGGAGTLEPV